MSTDERFDQRVAGILEELAPPRVPDYADLVRANARHSKQRPTWAFAARWVPFDLQKVRVAPLPSPIWLVVVVGLLALLVAAAYIGSRPRVPSPFGPAANGLIAFDDGSRIVVTDGTGRAPLPLTSGPGVDSRASFSPDGLRIAFWREDGPRVSLMTAEANGSNVRELAATGPGILFALEPPAWSPASDRVAVTVIDETGTGPHAEIWIVEVGRGSRTVFLPATLFGAEGPRWSPDGTRLAFRGEPTRRAESFLYAANVDGTGLIRLAERASSAATGYLGVPRWSPDGRQILVEFGNVGRLGRDIILLATDRLDETLLIATGKDETSPAWSPDGNRLAFWRSTTGFLWRVVVRDLDSGLEEASTLEGPTADTILWSPDGEIVTVSRCEATRCELLRLDPDDPSGPPILVAQLPPKSYDVSYDQAYWSWQRLAP